MPDPAIASAVFPTIPESSRFDQELESLCRFAAWVGAGRGEEAPLTFSALLVAFLTGTDVISRWFQGYAPTSAHDTLFAKQGITDSSLKDARLRANQKELPVGDPLVSRSTIQVFETADQIAKLVTAKVTPGDPPAAIGARHVMAAYAFRPPSDHVQELNGVGFDLTDWQTSLMAFLRQQYSAERWDIIINPNAGPNASDMDLSEVAAQVPKNNTPSRTGALNTAALNTAALNAGVLNLSTSTAADRNVVESHITPNSATLTITTKADTAGTEPIIEQSRPSATGSTLAGQGTINDDTPIEPNASINHGPTGPPTPPREPGNLASLPIPPAPPIRTIQVPLVGRYTADDPDATADDLLEIDMEAAGFARIVAARSIRPPMAIGIFGEWGSGKTYFMRRIQWLVESLRHSPQAKDPAPLFYADIVQIRFNAWHYIETNLWASLVEYIFSALDTWIQSQAEGDPKRTDLVFNRLATAQQLQIDALEKVVQFRAMKHSAELRAQRTHQDYAAALTKSARLKPDTSLRAMLQTFLDTDANAKTNLRSISDALALPALESADDRLKDVLVDARTTSGHARLVTRSLISKLGTWHGFFAIVCILAAFPVSSLLLGLLADTLPGSYIGQFVRQFATHTALTLLVVAGFLQSALAKARAALNNLSTFDAQLQRSIDQQLEDAKDSPAAKASQAAEADLLKCQQAVIAADSALNEASVKLAAARREFESGTARGRLNAFVRAKVIDGEYAKHLGIIASIRKDFVQLASLMHATDDSKAELVERQKLRLESVLRVQRFLDWLKTAPDIRLTAAELYSLFALLEPEEAIIQFEHYKEDIATHFEDDQQSLDAIKNDLLKAKATPLPRFSRIVLYIDDLDRCPPAKVVDVLQAVHLLLCFPLFVVIVAVDARWVSRALHERFPNLLADTPFSETLPQADAALISGATSDDYLEKIFQIPYWVRPLEATAAATYVHEIAKTDRIPIAVPTRDSSATLGVIPPVPPVTGTAATTSAAPDAATAAPIIGPSGSTASVGANPGLIAPASDATELAVGMSLSEWEIDALRAFAPFVGRTPRHAIRFVNIYRLIKTTLSLQVFDASALEQGTDARSRPLIPHLAIVTGAPYAAPQYFHYLEKADGKQLAQAFFSQLATDANTSLWAHEPVITGVFEIMLERESALAPAAPLTVADLQFTSPTVRRYSFTARLQ